MGGNDGRRGGRAGATVFVCALAVVMVACGGDGTDTPRIDPRAEEGVEPAGKDFFFDPAAYVGREIIATGYVSDVLTPVAFRIAGERFEGPGILVVSADELSTLGDGDLVQVVGTVRWFKTEVFARDLGVALDPVTFHEFEGGVAIAAQRVTVNGVRP